MRICSIRTENILRCKLAEIPFNDGVLVLSGKNRQGKTSFAKSIWMAFGGKDAIPEDPVTDGAEFGTVDVDLEDFVLSRKIYPDRRTVLELRNREGARFGSPQKMLDEFNLKFAFWPQNWLRMKEADQVASLKEIAGIDFAPLDKERDQLYEERTAINRNVKQLEAELSALGELEENTPDAEVSAAELLERLGDLAKANAEVDVFIGRTQAKKQTLQNYKDRADGFLAKIRELEELLERARCSLREQEISIDALELEIETRESQVPQKASTAELEEKIRNVDAVNARVRSNKARVLKASQLAELKDRSNTYTCRLQGIEQEKADMMAKAKLPIEGLGIDDRGVTINGKLLQSASSAEQWEIASAIGFARNPKLKLLYIQDGALLDDDAIERLLNMVERENAQIILEIMGDGSFGVPTVVFEDGIGELQGGGDGE